jgi:hypothetical protein
MKSHVKALSNMIVAGLVVAVPAVSSAADTDNPTGPYVGGSIGQFNLDLEHLDDVDDAARRSATRMKRLENLTGYPSRHISASGAVDFGRPVIALIPAADGNYDVKLSGFAPSLILCAAGSC